MEKPDVDSIEGLSPAISIEQKSVSRNPRSTVGTVTEIHDYLRLLFSSVGVPHCPNCHGPIRAQTVQQMVDRVMDLPEKTKLILLSPYVRGKKGEYKKQLDQMSRDGFARVRIDGETYELSGDLPDLDKQKKHDIDVVVDRLVIKPGIASRVAESLETALKVSGGLVVLQILGGKGEDDTEELLSQNYSCATCGFSLPEISPRLFSFNSPHGACTECSGLGTLMQVDEDKLVADEDASISEGAIGPWKSGSGSYQMRMVETLAETFDFSLDTAWKKLPAKARKMLMYGTDKEVEFSMQGKRSSYSWQGTFEGLVNRLERRYKETDSAGVRSKIEEYMSVRDCPACDGHRLRREALAVKVSGWSVSELVVMPVDQLLQVVKGFSLSEREKKIVAKVLQEIRDRLGFLDDVGVGYLTLERSAATLSGGESQRIRLATQIGSKLMGVLYVLDEPSIGLHQRDNARLIRYPPRNARSRQLGAGGGARRRHHPRGRPRARPRTGRRRPWRPHRRPGYARRDREEPRVADRQVSVGRAGDRDSRAPQDRSEETTRRPRRAPQQPEDDRRLLPPRRPDRGHRRLGLGQVEPGERHPAQGPGGPLLPRPGRPGGHDRSTASTSSTRSSRSTRAPSAARPGRTRRPTPASSRHPRADGEDARGAHARLQAGRFSFNVAGGRCESCKGDGQIKIEMHFLPDIYVTCEVCGGKRYDRETLNVRYKGLNIAEILDLTVEQALRGLRAHPADQAHPPTIDDVGLGYIHLGQPATTISGGEAQRVKLATELCKRSTGRTLYLLDEPTTGLHFEDVRKLLEVLHRLVDKGNTVIVVEHNLEVIKTADWLLDLGPEGGNGGGEIVAQGTPEDVAETGASFTGQFLKRILEKQAVVG